MMIKHFNAIDEYDRLLNNLVGEGDTKKISNLLNSVSFIDGDNGGIYFQGKKYNAVGGSESTTMPKGPVLINEAHENNLSLLEGAGEHIYQSAGSDLGSVGTTVWGSKRWHNLSDDNFKAICGIDYSTEDRQEYFDMFIESVANRGIQLHLIGPMRACLGENIEQWVNCDMAVPVYNVVCISYHTSLTSTDAGPDLLQFLNDIENPVVYDMYGMIYLDFDNFRIYELHRIANRPFIMPPTFVSQEDFDGLQDEVANIVDNL